jgi:hypothetical protein
MAERIRYVSPEAPPQQGAAPEVRAGMQGERAWKPGAAATSGLRVGTLDNRKHNAGHLLGMLVDGLRAQVRVESVFAQSKPTASSPATAEVLDRLAKESDVVVTAMAD